MMCGGASLWGSGSLQRTEPRKRAVLVHARQTAEPDDISRQDRCYLALAMF